MTDSKSEETRLKYLRRDLVLKMKIYVPIAPAKKIVGPDCAYHLYSQIGLIQQKSEEADD
ncbi:MAG: hypothetical protein JKX97_01565 [Candidatus Lindowbacteria bacterium]|nr:hypothetical protein [Candidatus Lindowbacteria bacterium]